MCTVTWTRNPAGCVLLFNRDEQRTRPPAEPPRVQERNGVAFLAALDPRAGGTWLAVNEYGMAVGLLNYYAAAVTDSSARPRSRGLLVLELATARAPEDVRARMAVDDLRVYPPFVLVVMDGAGRPTGGRWDGRQWTWHPWVDADRPLTTSSYASEQVVARRRERFSAFSDTREGLRQYHTSRDRADDAYSVWMSRPDAHTVSLTEITIAAERVRLAYSPRGGDDQPAPPVVVELPRR
jgi:hypothetical protein